MLLSEKFPQMTNPHLFSGLVFLNSVTEPVYSYFGLCCLLFTDKITSVKFEMLLSAKPILLFPWKPLAGLTKGKKETTFNLLKSEMKKRLSLLTSQN